MKNLLLILKYLAPEAHPFQKHYDLINFKFCCLLIFVIFAKNVRNFESKSSCYHIKSSNFNLRKKSIKLDKQG